MTDSYELLTFISITCRVRSHPAGLTHPSEELEVATRYGIFEGIQI